MVFSAPALGFLFAIVRYVARDASPRELGVYLQRTQEALDLSEIDRRKYSALLRGHLRDHLFMMQPETVPLLLKAVWQIPAPEDRKRPICCRDHLTRQVAAVYVKIYEEMWPDRLPFVLCCVYDEVAALGQQELRLFRPLGQYLITDVVDLEKCSDPTAIDEAWNIVRGRLDPLVWPGEDEISLNEDTDYDSEVQQLELELEAAVAESRMEEEALSAYRDPSFEVLKELCFEAYKAEYGDVLIRPYMSVYDHPKYGKLLVMCSIGGKNSKGQKVYAGARYGHSGEPEIQHKHMADISPWSIWGRTYNNAKTCFRAMSYVEGGYGKYWINIRNGEKRSDVLEFFFVLLHGAIHKVDKETYERRKKVARQPQHASFDVVDPRPPQGSAESTPPL